MAKKNTIPDSHFVQYTGLIGLKVTCPETLRLILEDYFGYPFNVERSQLTYQPISSDALTQIGFEGRNRRIFYGKNESLISF